MIQRKSILLVSGSLNKGGAERFVSTLLQHFDRARLRPSLCLMRDDIGYPLPADVSLHLLDYRRIWFLPRTILRLRRVINELQPDILLSNLHGTNVACGLALHGSEHQPVWVARVASNPAKNDGLIGTFLARRTYPRADRIAVNSRGLLGGMTERYPFTENRMDVLANPTDFEAIDHLADEVPELVKPAGTMLLIAVGRLGPEKRYDLMLDAFKRIRAEHAVELWICGDGPRRAAIERRIRRLELTDSVRLLGYRPNPYPLMRLADLFVMCSDYEGLPNVLIEAQGLGLPAVATRCPFGPEEIIEDGRTGLLTPVGDALALAGAISEILGDQDRRRKMASAAMVPARERFAAARWTCAWEALVLRQDRRPAREC